MIFIFSLHIKKKKMRKGHIIDLWFKSTQIVFEFGSDIRNRCRIQKLLLYYHVHKIHNIARSFPLPMIHKVTDTLVFHTHDSHSFYYDIPYLYEILFGKTLKIVWNYVISNNNCRNSIQSFKS